MPASLPTHGTPAPLTPSAGDRQRIEVPPPPGWRAAADVVWFEVEGARVSLTAGPEVIAATHLLKAMHFGRDLLVPPSFDPGLLAQLPAATNMLSGWFPPLRSIRLRTDHDDHDHEPASPTVGTGAAGAAGSASHVRGRGCFFTGGVNSFRTLQRCLDEIDTLVYVSGFEDPGPGQDPGQIQATRAMLDAVATGLGKRLIIVRTNLRCHTDRVASWNIAHGIALATVARLLQDELSELRLASGFADGNLIPWGSHPALDACWSTPTQGFHHDGASETRLQKLAALLEWPLALQHLRVCTCNTAAGGPRGSCSKGLRTMAMLELLDAGGRVPDLPDAFDARQLRDFTIQSFDEVTSFELIAAEARRQGPARLALAEAAEHALGRHGLTEHQPPRHLGLVPPPVLRVTLDSYQRNADSCDWSLALRWLNEVHLIRAHWGSVDFIPGRDDVADAAFCWLVPAAMLLGVELEFDASLPVDSELIERVRMHQPAMTRMPPISGSRVAPLHVIARPPAAKAVRRDVVVATAFSGGLDGSALAVLIKPAPSVLICLHGIDAENQGETRRALVEQRTSRAAAAVAPGVPLVFVNTNLRAILTGKLGVRWSTVFRAAVHGAGHLTGSHANVFAIASDHGFSHLVTNPSRGAGSHPVMFEMFTSSRVRQEYWDHGHDRTARVAAIAALPGAISSLSVCAEGAKGNLQGDRPNCGRCEKCLRTMANILLAARAAADDGQADFSTFAEPFDPGRLASLPRLRQSQRTYWLDILTRVQSAPDRNADLEPVVTDLLRRSDPALDGSRDWMKNEQVVADLRRHPAYPEWLRQRGRGLAAAAFADQPARRALQWLHHVDGWKHFRKAALSAVTDARGRDGVRRWLRRARLRKWLRLQP